MLVLLSIERINFVVLGGDTEIIPTRKLRSSVQSSSVHTGDIPSDLYYSALDGNWDSNQNGIYGEPAEADLLPELAIGRIPFSNTTELNNFLSKITRYAFSPVIFDTNRPLLAGEHLWDNPLTWGAQYLDLIVGLHDDNGYTTQVYHLQTLMIVYMIGIKHGVLRNCVIKSIKEHHLFIMWVMPMKTI